MTIHMQINSPELWRQHQARKERAIRLGDRPQRIATRVMPWAIPDAHVRLRKELMSADACAHVRVWRKVMRRPVDLDVVQLDRALRPKEAVRGNVGQVRQIIDVVAQFYGIEAQEIMSHRRTACFAKPRQICMYLAKTLTIRTMPEIAKIMGGRDHTTIMHGVRKITRLMVEDAALGRDIAEITARLVGDDA